MDLWFEIAIVIAVLMVGIGLINSGNRSVVIHVPPDDTLRGIATAITAIHALQRMHGHALEEIAKNTSAPTPETMTMEINNFVCEQINRAAAQGTGRSR